MTVVRLSKAAKELNVGISTIVEFLHKKGFVDIDANPNNKVSEEMFNLLKKEYKLDQTVKKASEELVERLQKDKKETVSITVEKEGGTVRSIDKLFEPKKNVEFKVVGKIDLKEPESKKPEKKPESKVEEKPVAVEAPVTPKAGDVQPKTEKQPSANEEKTVKKETEIEHIPLQVEEVGDVTVVSKIDLEPVKKKKKKKKKSKAEREAARALAAVAESNGGQQQPTTIETVAEAKPQKEGETAVNVKKEEDIFVFSKVQKLSGPTVLGKIDLPVDKKTAAAVNGKLEEEKKKKKKRKRIKKEKEKVDIAAVKGTQQHPKQGQGQPKQGQGQVQHQGQPKVAGEKKDHAGAHKNKNQNQNQKDFKKRQPRPEVNEEDVAKQIKDTLARLTSKGKSKTSRHRRDKRDIVSQRQQEEIDRRIEDRKTIRVTEFVTANELSSMMDIPVNQVIASFMSLGLFVSINQRLDAESIALVAEEFGYRVEFVSVSVAESIVEVEDSPEDMVERPPIVTVMGHVDHGKTSLLDYIRNTDVITGEAGGITQHIGAYSVQLKSGRHITFLDTPGHEAFTAMRARGAQVTDIAIIIVAADDNVMPQTVEAINHAAAAGVPIVFAINKIDKPAANPEKVKEELAKMNYLVEDWGGKYQSQEISAKKGINVRELLEKVLLEADIQELKANPNKPAVGSVIESTLDKGRGFVATLLVQAGTLKVGDMILSGSHYGRVKAMFNERNQKLDVVGPSEPVVVLGLNGAPQAGEKFNVMESEKEVKEIASKRTQLQREQGLRAQKHITLDEIGRRIAIGNFQELNLVVKGDVDGSIEALSDSLIKLSTEEIQVNVIHKAVGGISESDIMLAAASNAIVIGFQVRPSIAARRLAEKEEIDVRHYSIIYNAIEEIKAAMVGMLSPEIKEQIQATVEVLETFKITKVGTIAGCIVKEGKVKRNSKVRVLRDGIVVYTGELESLRRFKDDAKEVAAGLECGLNIKNFNDIKTGDLIEAYEEIEITRTL
ncbi:MAG: translation initiation factor IF-2 [Cytophagaceae bacterium]|jgi:translation initiation factor IF-2|nr:translation initiation factor IF-2 [Cytophagaceae bacterium]